jgi:hypothetical protein
MNTHQEAIERVTSVGKIEDRYKAREYCSSNGYRIIRDTPGVISATQLDLCRFRIIAEKPHQS